MYKNFLNFKKAKGILEINFSDKSKDFEKYNPYGWKRLLDIKCKHNTNGIKVFLYKNNIRVGKRMDHSENSLYLTYKNYIDNYEIYKNDFSNFMLYPPYCHKYPYPNWFLKKNIIIFFQHFNILKNIDKIGSPNIMDLSHLNFPNISPHTFDSLLTLTKILKYINIIPKKIIEIGGSYGNLCHLLYNKFNFNKYLSIELPYKLETQKYYFSHFPEINNKLKYIKPDDALSHLNKDEYDLFISIWAIDELTDEYFDKYINNFLTLTKHGIIFMMYDIMKINKIKSLKPNTIFVKEENILYF